MGGYELSFVNILEQQKLWELLLGMIKAILNASEYLSKNFH